MPVPVEGNEEDVEALFEEAAEDFCPPHCHYIEEGALSNMFANVRELKPSA